MSNTNTAVILEEGQVKSIAPAGTFIYALTAPTNEGFADIYLYTSGIGGSAPSLNTLLTLGSGYHPNQQIQFQDLTFGNDLAAIFGTVVPGSAPAPSATIAAGSYMCDVGTGGFPTVAGFVKNSFTQPAVGNNVTITMFDVTPFSGLSAGDDVYVGGGLYDFVSTSGGVGGTITLTNLGLGGARVTISA